MRTNSGEGDSTNNNRDQTLRDHEGSKGPAQTSSTLDQQEDDAKAKAPADSREDRKDK